MVIGRLGPYELTLSFRIAPNRRAAAAGLSAEDQANLAAGSDSVAVQQQALVSEGDAVVAGAAGAAAFLAHSTRAALRDAARRDDAS